MTIQDPGNPLLPASTEQPRRSARERQRKGPMWGCLRAMIIAFIAGILFLGETANAPRLVAALLIVSGLLLMKLSDPA